MRTATVFDSDDVLDEARLIVLTGGDQLPCSRGQYCLRCCIAIAKGNLDQTWGYLSDGPLHTARDRLAMAGDDGIAHSRESALAMLDKAIGPTPGA